MNQTEQILNYLKKGNKITPLQALKRFGCFRLASRIWDIRNMGYDIQAMRINKKGIKHFCQYSLK